MKDLEYVDIETDNLKQAFETINRDLKSIKQALGNTSSIDFIDGGTFTD